MKLVDHFERRLGRISGGKGCGVTGVQIVHYENGRFHGVDSWSTLGVSRHVLTVRGTEGRHVLEVFLAVRKHPGSPTAEVGRCVEWVASEMVGRHEARIRGDVQRLPAPIDPTSVLDHVYFANPVYYDDDFCSVELEPNGPDNRRGSSGSSLSDRVRPSMFANTAGSDSRSSWNGPIRTFLTSQEVRLFDGRGGVVQVRGLELSTTNWTAVRASTTTGSQSCKF